MALREMHIAICDYGIRGGEVFTDSAAESGERNHDGIVGGKVEIGYSKFYFRIFSCDILAERPSDVYVC